MSIPAEAFYLPDFPDDDPAMLAACGMGNAKPFWTKTPALKSHVSEADVIVLKGFRTEYNKFMDEIAAADQLPSTHVEEPKARVIPVHATKAEDGTVVMATTEEMLAGSESVPSKPSVKRPGLSVVEGPTHLQPTVRPGPPRAVERQQTAASSRPATAQPSVQIVPGRAIYRNGVWTIEDATDRKPEEPLQLHIDPASIRSVGSLGTKVAVLTSLLAGGIGLSEGVAAAAMPKAETQSVSYALAPSQAAHETTPPTQDDSLAGLDPALKSLVEKAAQLSKDPRMPFKLALVAERYEKYGVIFGAPEKEQIREVAAKRGLHIDFNQKLGQLEAAAVLMDLQQSQVKPMTGDGDVDTVLAFILGPAGAEKAAKEHTSKLQAALTTLKAYESALKETPKAPQPAVAASTEKPAAADPLPGVNPAIKQVILDAAKKYNADPSLLVALFKTYNGTYTEALQHPLNMQEGWMGLSKAAAHGINRDDFAASAEIAAEMLANTAGMPVGDLNHFEKDTALYEALAYRFGTGVINTYMANPHHLKATMLNKINEYKDYDFKTLTQLASGSHATPQPSSQPAPAAPAVRPAAPAPPPKPQLPASAPAQSKELSAKILADPNITVDSATPHDRVQKSLTTNEQDGKTFIDDTNHAPSVTLSPQLQQDVLVLANQGFKVKITSVTTGAHVANSDHYKGYAMDIAPASGSAADYQKMVDFLFAHRGELKIDQLIYGGTLPTGVRLLSNGQPLANAVAFYGQATLNEHKSHIHMSVLDSVGSQPLPPTTIPGQITPPQPPAAAPVPKPAPVAPSAAANSPAPESSTPAHDGAPTPLAPTPSSGASQNTITVEPAQPAPAPTTAAPSTPPPAPKPEAAPKPAPAIPTALTPEQQALIDKQPLSAKSKQFEAAILLALEQEKVKGAPINVQIGLDQAMLESGNGTSDIVFGVKGGGPNSVKAPTKEYVNGKEVSTTDSFKVYPDLPSAVKGYVQEIETDPWYKDAASASDNPDQYLKGLQSGGLHYASDPDYSEKIKSRQGYLKLDKVAQATAAPEPVSPAPAPKPQPKPTASPTPQPTESTPAPAPSLTEDTPVPTDNTPTISVAPAPSVDAAPTTTAESPNPSSSETSDAGSKTPVPIPSKDDASPSHTDDSSKSPSQAPTATVQPSASSDAADTPTPATSSSSPQLPVHIDHGKLDRLMQ